MHAIDYRRDYQRRHTLRSSFQLLDWSQPLIVKGSENLTTLIVR